MFADKNTILVDLGKISNTSCSNTNYDNKHEYEGINAHHKDSAMEIITNDLLTK